MPNAQKTWATSRTLEKRVTGDSTLIPQGELKTACNKTTDDESNHADNMMRSLELWWGSFAIDLSTIRWSVMAPNPAAPANDVMGNQDSPFADALSSSHDILTTS